MLRRISYTAGLLSVILAATLVCATVEPLEKSGDIIPLDLNPFSHSYHSASFLGGRMARAVCVGNHRSFIGLYVCDRHGNCVAWDDVIASRSRQSKIIPDAVVGEWVPPETDAYYVDVVNFGGDAGETCELSLK